MSGVIPLFERDGFIICFEALPEDTLARRYFIKECGWTEAQWRKIKNFAWFCARISAWKDGQELAAEYLGCCCYRTSAEFYTRYKDDYFADMVKTAIEAAKKATV